jgi:hypothetical protein
LGRTDVGNAGRLEQRFPHDEIRGRRGFCRRLRDELPLLAGGSACALRIGAYGRSNSLSSNAYRMYLIHYVFAVWLQYALLGAGLLAIGKAAIVFGWDADHELVDRRRDRRRAAGVAAQPDDPGNARRIMAELTLHRR